MGTRTVRFASATVVALCVTTVGSLSIPAASAGSPAAQKKGASAAAEVSIRGVALYPVRGGDSAGGLAPMAASATGPCGVRTDMPHASNTTVNQIHTRAESYCYIVQPTFNNVSATTYRSRWWGWESQGSKSKAGAKPTVRVTVAINCTRGDWYRYRTNSRGYMNAVGQTYTAASYEQNDSAIRCR